MGVTEEAGKAVTTAVDAMSTRPAAVALLSMNIIILIFAGYIAKTQLGMIGQLVTDIRDCRQGPKP